MQIPSSTTAGHHIPAPGPAGRRKFDAIVATDLPEEIFAELRRPSQPTKVQPTKGASPSEQRGKVIIPQQNIPTPVKANDGNTPIAPTYRAHGPKAVSVRGAVTPPQLGTMIDVVA